MKHKCLNCNKELKECKHCNYNGFVHVETGSHYCHYITKEDDMIAVLDTQES